MMNGNRYFDSGGCLDGGYMNGGYFSMWHLVILAGIILIILALVIWAKKKGTGTVESADKALDILREKYAQGEITEEEFTNRKNVLLKK